jgi:molecular chaperone HtpG
MHLTEFDEKPLQSVAKGELDLGELEAKTDKEQQEKAAKEHKEFVDRVKQALGDKVKDVRITHRLTTSPACLVADTQNMSANLERILTSVGQDVALGKPILEINPGHPIVNHLMSQDDNARFKEWSYMLFDQALLSEGGQLDDPAGFVHRLNELFLQLAGK